MNVYIILAHPEEKSFNTSLANAQMEALIGAGHQVRYKNLHQEQYQFEKAG